MKSFLLAILFSLLCIGLFPDVLVADSEDAFQGYMDVWNEKRGLASKYLLEAEVALKEGDVLTGCATQKIASQYGVEATESLIQAIKLKGTSQEVENLQSGLNKWKEIGDYC